MLTVSFWYKATISEDYWLLALDTFLTAESASLMSKAKYYYLDAREIFLSITATNVDCNT